MKKMLIILPLLLLCSCTDNETAEPAELENVRWNLSYLKNPKDVKPPEKSIYIQFDGNRISGHAGVNSFSGGYTIDADGTFKSGPYMSTRMAGPGLDYEQLFLKTLEEAGKLVVASNTLSFYKGTEMTISFKAAPKE